MKPLKAEPPHLPPPVPNSNRTATHTATTARRKPGKCNRRKTLHKVLTFSWWFENSGCEKGERETSRKMGEMKMKAQTQRRRRNQYKHKLVKAYIDWERKSERLKRVRSDRGEGKRHTSVRCGWWDCECTPSRLSCCCQTTEATTQKDDSNNRSSRSSNNYFKCIARP